MLNPSRQLTARLAALGLGGVLVILAGFALWAATASEHSAEQLSRARLLTDAYQTARFAMDDERLLEHQYMLGHGGIYATRPSRAIHQRFDAIATGLDRALTEVTRRGSAADRRLAAQLSVEQRSYHENTDAIFSAVAMGNTSMARMHGSLADHNFARLRDQMTAVTQTHDAEALRSLSQLHSTQTGIRRATTVVIPFGLVLFAVFALVLRAYRRREAEFTQTELARWERQALIDNLTGLRNQRAFEEDLGREVARVDRSGEPLTLVLLDLDGLKQTNDRAGHQAGDERLRELADSMRSALRSADVAYRIAGDEFAILLPNTRSMGGMQAAQRVHDQLRRRSQAGATAGIAESGPGVDRDELIRKSDLALIEAKRASRGMLVYSQEMEQAGTADPFDPGLVGLTTVAAALARAVDAKDSHTHSHSETVAEVCALIGAEMGLDPNAVGALRLAGLLHDVGKIGIPDAILSKAGPLTEEEYAVMKGHSRLGHGIVDATGLRDQADWILHHHERIDGGGYPDGLAGEAIPLQSRIILVADAYEAMTADRPYRAGRPSEEAVAELRLHSGTQFDPRCVEMLESVLNTSSPRTGVA